MKEMVFAGGGPGGEQGFVHAGFQSMGTEGAEHDGKGAVEGAEDKQGFHSGLRSGGQNECRLGLHSVPEYPCRGGHSLRG